jgi:hypothetical protein
MVQLSAGMKTTVPELDIPQARYCGAVGKPPVPNCSRKAINEDYNN